MKEHAEYRLAENGFNRMVRGRHGVLLYNHYDVYIGRSIERYGEFSEGEVDLFRQIIRPGFVVVEAGANIGAHTLALSQLVGDKGAVFAFEPQRIVFQTLCANLALNSRTNVFCFWRAVGKTAGSCVVPLIDYSAENNFGGLALGGFQSGESVPMDTIDSLGLSRCHFIKADVEGMELSVLQGAEKTINRHRPVLYVENDRKDRSGALIEYLLSLGYKLYWHLPPMFNPANHFANPENAFGNIVSVNMLGIHSAIQGNIQGLRPVEGPDSDWRAKFPP